jgi:hypothetical protein
MKLVVFEAEVTETVLAELDAFCEEFVAVVVIELVLLVVIAVFWLNTGWGASTRTTKAGTSPAFGDSLAVVVGEVCNVTECEGDDRGFFEAETGLLLLL